MNSLARFSRVPVVALLLLLVVAVVAGCAPDANSALLAPDLGPKLVMAQSEGAIVIEPTAVPPKLAELAADEITAGLEHEGSGYAVTRARITSGGKKVADSQLKFRTVAFDQVPLADIVRSRAGEVGLLTAMANAAGERQ